MMKSLTLKVKMRKMTIHAFRTLQRPPSSQKIFLECSSLSNYPLGVSNEEQSKLCFCPCSNSSQPWREKSNILIKDYHGCKATARTPQELLRHLKNEGDCTHTAISIYLQTLNSFSRGHVRQDPGVNPKKKPDSDKEEKEEEREEEEEEVAAALNNNDVSCEQADTYACDHSKQGLETQIASETHKDPVSLVTDGCESAKDVLDDIEKEKGCY
jgi:hypothetical protein